MQQLIGKRVSREVVDVAASVVLNPPLHDVRLAAGGTWQVKPCLVTACWQDSSTAPPRGQSVLPHLLQSHCLALMSVTDALAKVPNRITGAGRWAVIQDPLTCLLQQITRKGSRGERRKWGKGKGDVNKAGCLRPAELPSS